MAQYILTIEKKEDVSLIRQILKKFDGVTLTPINTKKKSAYEKSMDDKKKKGVL